MAEADDLLAVMCWLEARGQPFREATLPQIVGALQEIGHRRVAVEGVKAQIEVSAMLKGFFKIRK